MSEFYLNFNHLMIRLSTHIIIGIVIFLGFLLIGILLSRLILRVTKNAPTENRPLFVFLAKVTNIVLIILGIITALGNIGINVSALVASLGLTSFGLGFALKDALSNVLSGILVLIYRPFRINDQVKIGDAVGTVVNIDLRYVTLQGDAQRILIPNANLFSNSITVLSKEERRSG